MPRIQGVDLPPDKPAHISLLRHHRTTPCRLCDQLALTRSDGQGMIDDEIAWIAAISIGRLRRRRPAPGREQISNDQAYGSYRLSSSTEPAGPRPAKQDSRPTRKDRVRRSPAKASRTPITLLYVT